MNTIMFPRLTGICAGWVREHLADHARYQRGTDYPPSCDFPEQDENIRVARQEYWDRSNPRAADRNAVDYLFLLRSSDDPERRSWRIRRYVALKLASHTLRELHTRLGKPTQCERSASELTSSELLAHCRSLEA